MWSEIYNKGIICADNDSFSPRQRSSDPAQHTCDPPVAWHDDVTDDSASLVVVGPRVEATQGLVVATAVADTTPAVLAAVAALVQMSVQLDSNLSLWRTGNGPGLQSHA